jgi:hypothetical protein
VRFGQRLAENLILHALAAEQALQFAHPLLELANLRTADDWLVRSHGRRASLAHQAPPAIEKVCRHAMAPGDR